MRAASDLKKLSSAMQYRIKRIKDSFALLPTRPRTDVDLVITRCVIELDNAVVCAVREFTVSSLIRARTTLGHRVSTNRAFKREDEISAFILSIVNTVQFQRWKQPTSIRREDEPTVRDPKDTEKILSACAASNLPSLQSALSLNASLFRDLATVRNFYAHRKENTWGKVRNKARDLGITGVSHPNDVVLAVPLGQTARLFDTWIAEAELFFEELMK